MELLLDEIALICAGSTTNKKDAEKYLKKQLRNPRNKLENKKIIKRALNLLQNWSQEEFEIEVMNFLIRTFHTNFVWK